MARCDTNLASEYYILSCLHRLGFEANLTLGNKKGVDVVVARESGDAITVEVKGLAGKNSWRANNLSARNPERHFIALVSFEGQIDEPEMPAPLVWIVPFSELRPFMSEFRRGHTDVSRTLIIRNDARYRNAWHLIAGAPFESSSSKKHPKAGNAPRQQRTEEERKAIGLRLQTARAAKVGLTLDQWRLLRVRPGATPGEDDIARAKTRSSS